MRDFRSISLCNVIYKVLSKALTNHLKGVYGKCILEEQSAFIKGWNILDNALIENEISHHMKCKVQGKNKWRDHFED